MPDCFKASDRSQTLSETDTFKSVVQEQCNGRQDTCSRSDTASKHLPSLSLSEADQVRDLLSKIEKLLTDSQQHSRRQDYGERSNDCSERHSEYGSGRRSEHRSERHRENFSQGGHCRRDSNNSGSRYEDESRGNYGDDSESDYGDHSDAGSGSDYGDSSNNHGSDAGSDNDWPNTDHEPWMPPREEDESIPDYTPPNSSISELTNLSEQLLPVHANGSYPAPAKWESLHSANIQRAKDAAQNGSNMEFFGDSITEALGHDPAAMKPFIDNFGSFKPAALGIGGDGTKQLFYRLNH